MEDIILQFDEIICFDNVATRYFSKKKKFFGRIHEKKLLNTEIFIAD